MAETASDYWRRRREQDKRREMLRRIVNERQAQAYMAARKAEGGKGN